MPLGIHLDSKVKNRASLAPEALRDGRFGDTPLAIRETELPILSTILKSLRIYDCKPDRTWLRSLSIDSSFEGAFSFEGSVERNWQMRSTQAIDAPRKARTTRRVVGAGPAAPISLHNGRGRRKYLTAGERGRFLRAAQSCEPKIETLCLLLAWTGCRISEALALTHGDVDGDAGIVSVRCLKKRRRGVVREIPVPTEFLTYLHGVHGNGHPDDRLWSIARTTAWRHVKRVMAEARVGETAASPKGLRHGFGVHAVRSGIPLNLLQRWLGHASLATTAIYTHVVGAEEREIAARMWRTDRPSDGAN